MNRTTKQILYGAFYVLFWCLVFYVGYRLTLKPPASCVDEIRNRDEVEVDCGGSFCPSCEIKRLAPIEFVPVVLLSGTDESTTSAIVEIRNQNPAYGTARLTAEVRFLSAEGEALYTEPLQLPMYPSELKYRLLVNLPVARQKVARAEVAITAPYEWLSIAEFARPKTPLRDVKVQYTAASGGRATITGLVRNDNPFSLRRSTLSVIILDAQGEPVAASKTFVQDLLAAEERFFKIEVPLPTNTDTAKLGEPRVVADAER
jgi:hypothetical protein